MPFAFFSIFFLLGCASARPKTDAVAASARAAEHFDQKRFDEAMVQAEIARTINPELFEPYWTLFRIYEKMDKKDRALDILLEGLQKNPNPPPESIHALYKLSTQTILVAIRPAGKEFIASARGITDSAKAIKIRSALAQNPRSLLQFAEFFVNEKNITDTFRLLEGFKCAGDLAWYYGSILAKGYFYFGREEDFLKAVRNIAQTPSSDYRRMYEAGILCLKAGEDDLAEKLLRNALKLVPSEDSDIAKKISFALKYPEVILDGEDP